MNSLMTSILKVAINTYLEDDSKPHTTGEVQKKKSKKETKQKHPISWESATPSPEPLPAAAVGPVPPPSPPPFPKSEPEVVQKNQPPVTTSSSGTRIPGFTASYMGEDIVVSDDKAYVPVLLEIEGVGKVQATALYDTKRYVYPRSEQDAKTRYHSSNKYKSDNLTLITKNGSATSTAFYPDSGKGVKTTVSKVVHVVHSATGDLSELKGNYIVIDFDYCTEGQPRKMTLEEGPSETNKKKHMVGC